MLRTKALKPVICGLMFVFAFAYPRLAAAASPKTYIYLNLLGDVIDRVNSSYVEEVDVQKLVEDAISGIMSGLDARASYINPQQLREMQVQTRGEISSVGLELTLENSIAKIIAPIPNTPASRAGIQNGDLITHIDNEGTGGLTLSQIVELIRGPVGSHVTLTINRAGVKQPLDVTLIREIIRIDTVTVNAIDYVVYIKVRSFRQNTSDQLLAEVETVKKNLGADLKGYVLDLRDNHGGLLAEFIDVVDAFLARGLILSIRGRTPEDIQRYQAKEGDITDGKRLIVLVNQNTAAGAEMVAGALQDHKRATLVGTKTLGEGSLQTIIPLGDHGAIRLTTGRLYTPSGRTIEGRGIEPDIAVLRDAENDYQLQHALQMIQEQ